MFKQSFSLFNKYKFELLKFSVFILALDILIALGFNESALIIPYIFAFSIFNILTAKLIAAEIKGQPTKINIFLDDIDKNFVGIILRYFVFLAIFLLVVFFIILLGSLFYSVLEEYTASLEDLTLILMAIPLIIIATFIIIMLLCYDKLLLISLTIDKKPIFKTMVLSFKCLRRFFIPLFFFSLILAGIVIIPLGLSELIPSALIRALIDFIPFYFFMSLTAIICVVAYMRFRAENRDEINKITSFSKE